MRYVNMFANNVPSGTPSLKGITYRRLQVSRAVSDNLSCNYYLLRRNHRKFDPLVQPGRVAYKIHLNTVTMRQPEDYNKVRGVMPVEY